MNILSNEAVDSALTIDSAKNGTAVEVNAKGAPQTVAFVVTASAASSPTGTTIQLAASLDNTNWILLGSTVSVTGNGSFTVSDDRPKYKYYRIAYARSSGSYVANTQACVKGN